MQEFFYRDGDEVVGPISLERFDQLAAAGTITPDTPIRIGRDGKWYKASAVLERLQAVRNKQPPPTPAPTPRPTPPPLPESFHFDPTAQEPTEFVEVSGFREIRNQKPRSYHALRILISTYRVLGALIAAIGIVTIIFSLSHSDSGGFLSGIIAGGEAFLVAIFIIAAAEAIEVLLHLEENTRRTADVLESVRHAIEFLAAKDE